MKYITRIEAVLMGGSAIIIIVAIFGLVAELFSFIAGILSRG